MSFLEKIYNILNAEDLDKFKKSITIKKYLPDETIISPFDDFHGELFIVMKGSIDVYGISVRGKIIIFDVFCCGDIFMRDSYKKAFIDAREGTKIGILPSTTFKSMLLKNPYLSLLFVQELNRRLSRSYAKISDIGASGAYLSVLYQLKRLSTIFGEKDKNGNTRICATISHEKIAEHLGLTRETVTKNLLKLKQKGYISVVPPDRTHDFKHILLHHEKMKIFFE